jgi:hypothetical protein
MNDPRLPDGAHDEVVDGEIVDDAVDARTARDADDARVARDRQDRSIDAAAIDHDRERAAGALAGILEDDLELVVDFDDEGEIEHILEPGGSMESVVASGSSVMALRDMTPVTHAAGGGVSLTGAASPAGEEVEIECPGCGLAVVGFDPRPTAAWFCPRCDYPLFLARPAAAPVPDGATRGARRRLPGTGGRSLTAAGPCWNCGEWNEAGVVACLRCAATLPRPVAPTVPAEPVPAEIELVEVEVMYWPPVVIAVLGGFGSGMVFLLAVLAALGRL